MSADTGMERITKPTIKQLAAAFEWLRGIALADDSKPDWLYAARIMSELERLLTLEKARRDVQPQPSPECICPKCGIRHGGGGGDGSF